MKHLISISMLVIVIIAGCKKEEPATAIPASPSVDQVTDVDGNSYATVKIGSQRWMKANLRVTHYQNGDPIVNGFKNFDWWGAILANNADLTVFKGARTFPNGDQTNKIKYGLLYNNFTVDDSRGICPAGWHVPSETDWAILSGYLGGYVPTEADTLYQDSNNGAPGSFGTIADKVSVGGSSGLNLKMAGKLFINGPNDYQYNQFLTAGIYWGSSIAGYPSYVGANGAVENFYAAFGNGWGSPNELLYGFTYQYVASVRCIKN